MFKGRGTSEHVKEQNIVLKFGLAFAAAACAETVTYPLDVTKTRMQIAAEQQKRVISKEKNKFPKRNNGMLKTGIEIIKCEGVSGLMKGLSPALYRQFIYSPVRAAIYETIRDDIVGKNEDGIYPYHKAALTGLIAGGIAQFSATPMDIVRVQIQMEGRRRLEGKPARATGVFSALLKIWKESGFRGLWRGWAPNAQRGALVNLGDMTTYDSSKRFFLQHMNMKDGTSVHVLSSLMAGFAAAVMATPADVITTRVMNQPIQNGKPVYYKNSIDCLRKTVAREGFGSLYKGFLPIWMRLGPHSLTFWVCFEGFRKTCGVTGF